VSTFKHINSRKPESTGACGINNNLIVLGGREMAFPTHIVSVGGIVEDGFGNILLLKAHDDGWVYPGGITEDGEKLIDGVIREIKEESGIVVFSRAVHISNP
jgi:ADP-ribose pyrophosphatase YjhB (NUDIX family)